MLKRKGFTLMEMVFTLIIFSWILLIFAVMTSFNFKFIKISLNTDDIIQDYAANNTFIYIKIRESNTISVSSNKLTLDSGFFQIKDNKLYYNTEVLYDLIDTSNMTYIDGLLKIHLDLKNDLKQSVDIVFIKK